METKLKRELSNKKLIVQGRGSERTSASLKDIEKLMRSTKVEDTVTIVRRSERIRNQNITTEVTPPRRSKRIRAYSKLIY